MIGKYQNKYRIPSARLQNWDYGWNGIYFIPICSKNRRHYFGEIVNGVMRLSNIGVIADIFWHEIKNHSKNIELDAFVVMPNHIHGILVLNGDDGGDDDGGRDVACNVSTSNTSNMEFPKNEFMAKISPKSDTVGRITGSYKSAVTKHDHRLGYEFQWQSRFYDHIIRNDREYDQIKNYIINNSINWHDDKFYK